MQTRGPLYNSLCVCFVTSWAIDVLLSLQEVQKCIRNMPIDWGGKKAAAALDGEREIFGPA